MLAVDTLICGPNILACQFAPPSPSPPAIKLPKFGITAILGTCINGGVATAGGLGCEQPDCGIPGPCTLCPLALATISLSTG